MNRTVGASLLLVLALVVLYSVSLGHPFLFDEENIIVRNPFLRSFENLPQVFTRGFFQLAADSHSQFLEYYRPLSILTFMVDYRLWGLDAMGFNVTSLLLHILLSLVFFALARRVLAQEAAALFAALLYAVHPIHTEALGHVSCRSETLAALALCGAVWLHLSGKRSVAALVLVAGILCKESSVLIAGFIAAADLCFLKGSARERAERLGIYFLISAAYMLIRASGFPSPMPESGDTPALVALRTGSMAGAFADYFRTLFWPPFFQLFGSISFAKRLNDPVLWLTSAIYAAAAVSIWRAWAGAKRTACFAQVVFWGGFIPYLQLRHFYPEWAEHFLTVPLLGFALLMGLFFRAAFAVKGRSLRIAVLLAAALWLAALGARTYQRNAHYNDLGEYYQTLANSPSPYSVHGLHELAKLKMAEGQFEQASLLLGSALERGVNKDVTMSLLGTCLVHQGQLEAALEAYLEALHWNHANPQYAAEAGGVLVRLGRPLEAVDLYRDVLSHEPTDYVTVRLGMAALEMAGDAERSRQWGEISMGRMEGLRFERAALAVALVRLAHRQGWTDKLTADLPHFAEEYRDVPWHGLVLNYWSGQITSEDFDHVVRTRFADFSEEAKGMSIIASGLRRDAGLRETLLKADPSALEKWAAKDALCAKETELAVAAA